MINFTKIFQYVVEIPRCLASAFPIGVLSALRQDTWGDYVGRSFAIISISIPAFWLATLAVVFGSIWGGYSPPTIFISFTEDPIGNLKILIVPAIILGMSLCGIMMRLIRTMMLEVQREEYIRTAFEKQMAGLGFTYVEVLSACPTDWHLTPIESIKRIEREMIPEFPLGEFT